VAVVLTDNALSGSAVKAQALGGPEDVPGLGLADAGAEALGLAYAGAPAKVVLVTRPTDAEDYAGVFEELERLRFNILVFPGIAPGDVSGVAAWVKDAYENKEKKILAVLPNADAADHPAIVNFATSGVAVAEGPDYTAAGYAPRIAGIIAGKDLSEGITYQPLPEVVKVPGMTRAEADAAIAAGKLVLYHDGEKAKIARGVTSFVTATETMGDDYKKIKIVRILNQVYDDIKKTLEDSYIGKINNTYVNKLLIATAVNNYYETLERGGVLNEGMNRCEIDAAEQRAYLKTIMDPAAVAAMAEQQVKEADTRDRVFLASTLRPLDSIEDIRLVVSL
jgi:hypothetical protein